MINPKKLEEIAKQIADAVPAGVKNFAEDIETKTKQVLQRKLSNMDFVSRDEFDVQTQVLQRTREKLEALEKKVAVMMGEEEADVVERASEDEAEDTAKD
ncbi:MAG: accessory factor UbiK family protein [Psychrosphaera sp.]|nr:accessory factor UbiK family protein [Psychrosphaera sp.]